MIQEKSENVVRCPDSIHIAVPFSFRQPQPTVAEVKMNNDFGSLLLSMKLFDSFNDALPYYKELFGALKSSLNPFGVLYTTKMTVSLPFTLPKLLSEDLTRKFTIVYSNLMASRTNYVFDGKNMTGVFFFAPGVGKLGTGISILTIGEIISVGCFSDYNQMKDPQ